MKIAMTGGHHSSALPFIDFIREKESNIELLWFGHKHSMQGDENVTLEYRQITEKNIPFLDLPAGKFYRTFNIIRILKIPLGFVFAFYYLLKNKPDIIFSFGGYLAVPVVISGWLLGIPSITHEQTVVVGYANRVIAHFAKKVLISHKESAAHFPATKTVYSGIPLRKALFEVNSNSFTQENALPLLYITAGKTGSHKINLAISKCLSELLKRFNVIHQCGDHSEYNDYEMLSEAYSLALQETPPLEGKYYLRKFVLDDEIGEIFSKASVFLSRSGAHTIAEIETFKKAAVLIPIPWVSHNEQFLNAQVIVDLGLGVILPEDQLNCSDILTSLEKALTEAKNVYTEPLQYDETPLKIMYEELIKLHEKKIKH